MQRITIILMLLIATVSLFSQENRGFRYYDSLTYNQYLNESWKELSNSTTEAINQGHDYYYMRMRKAISMYERENYLMAVGHFRKALTFNPNDPVALEYLYYCYLLSGKESTAIAVSKHFSDHKKKKIAVASTSGNRLSLSAFYRNSSSDDLINDIENLDAYSEVGNIVISKQIINTNITASHYLDPAVKLKHAATYLRKQNFLYHNDGTHNVSFDDQTVKQLQYYISMIFSDGTGWRFCPAFHFINTAYPLVAINTYGGNSGAYTYEVKENSIIAGATLEKTAGIFDLTLAAHYAGLNNNNQYQGEAGLSLFPLGNTKLNLGYMHNLVFSEGSVDNELHHISEVFVGFSIANTVWIDFSAIIGEISNFHNANGLYVYNDMNNSDLAGRMDITVDLGEAGTYFFIGIAYSRSYTTYVPAETLNMISGKDSFNNISISGGLSWKF